MTDLEKLLIDVLARLVGQHLKTEDLSKDYPELRGHEVYTTGFITINKQALMLLTEVGVMKDVFPKDNWGNRWERLFYAEFVDNWIWKLYHNQLAVEKKVVEGKKEGV